MGENTLLVHGPQAPDPAYDAVALPLYLSANFRNTDFGEPRPYAYARGANPTRAYLEELIARLEGGRYAFAFSSGMTAIAAALAVLQAGDKVLVTGNVYGGTLALLNGYYRDFGLRYQLVDTSDAAALEVHFTPDVKAILLETPSNPLLDVTDIAAVSEIARRHGARTIVDNTFLSPYLQKPLTLGADIVVESATKFLGGHSDVIAGTAATNDEALAGKIGAFQKLAGGIVQPFDAYLLVRSIKTLGIRLERQQQNAAQVAAFLEGHPAVAGVRYPGLPTHPGYEIQRRQAAGGGALLSFQLAQGHDLKTFFDSLELFVHAPSLGAVESLVQHPATGSHREFTPEQRRDAGIADNLVRVSVGIEDAADLLEDLGGALAKSGAPKAAAV